MQSLEREETSRQIAADWYTLVPQMGMGSGMPMGGRPQTAAGRIRVQLEWLPPGASSVSELNTTAHLDTGDGGGIGVGEGGGGEGDGGGNGDKSGPRLSPATRSCHPMKDEPAAQWPPAGIWIEAEASTIPQDRAHCTCHNAVTAQCSARSKCAGSEQRCAPNETNPHDK